MSEKPEDVAKHPPARLAPWIGEFEVEDGTSTCFVFVEQSIYCSMKSFDKSLFAWFALFFVFNLEYHKQTNDLCLFFQEFVFGLPVAGQACKKSSTYLSVTTDIQMLANNVIV